MTVPATLPLARSSAMACIRHLINSVGQTTNEEKIDAKLPAHARCISLKNKLNKAHMTSSAPTAGARLNFVSHQRLVLV